MMPIIIDQTRRRVLKNEQVPAEDKLFSIFEPHTDIIVKGQRDCYFLRFKSRHSHLFSTLSYMSFVAVSVESSSPYGAARFAVGPYGEEDSTSRRWKALEAPHLGGREWGGERFIT